MGAVAFTFRGASLAVGARGSASVCCWASASGSRSRRSPRHDTPRRRIHVSPRPPACPDAATGYSEPTDAVEPRLAGLEGVESLRSAVGFVGFVEGVDQADSRVLLGPWGDYFPIELPHLREGRLPDPSKRNEVFVNEYLADRAKVSVGDELPISIMINNLQRHPFRALHCHRYRDRASRTRRG